MEIHQAEFKGSFVDWQKCPESILPEYAFIGRSNVGKSSLINMLTKRNSLAKISNTPGKTQCINFFEIDTAWHLVDLPGYGYAKTSKKNRETWFQFTKAYLDKRAQLVNTFLLIDARIEPQKIDIDFANWMGEKGIPFALIFTKNDKPKKTAENIEKFKTEILKYWDEMPMFFISSSTTAMGRDEILQYISSVNQQLLEV
ncbi:MAG: ribosome biogenesis GTP-binding protein YihA/YsxC [Chitinophagales bacterium]|nr:ribosome biogenesis GTP-binding protein YihA/YsxC [Chitinophagales bacterium]